MKARWLMRNMTPHTAGSAHMTFNFRLIFTDSQDGFFRSGSNVRLHSVPLDVSLAVLEI